MKASLLYPSQCYLGEGPLWHAERKSCFWVDIENGVLYEYHWLSKQINHWKFDGKLSMVLEGKNNHLILALNRSISKFNLEFGSLELLADIEKELTENRCNDGACDSHGRLWVGTMHLQHNNGAGSLYCIDHNLEVYKKVGKVTISNGLAWSPDYKRMYYIDSPTQLVRSFFFNEESGEIKFEKIVIRVPVEMGTPDGMAIDEEGMLWIAQWGGFGVYRWNPDSGKLIEQVKIPVPNVTSCAFAGEQLDHLIITTARENLSEQQLKKYPESGDVFCVHTSVKGMASYKCLL